MVLIVNVTHFEDITNATGEIVTVYIVHVKYSFKSSYQLSKRYSDFFDLYNSMKDFLPHQYKFPNKSLFSTGAQFTKERRIKGFDELLKILIKQEPFPLTLQRFLELQERVSIGSRDNFIFLTYASPPGGNNNHAPSAENQSTSHNRRSLSRYPSLANVPIVEDADSTRSERIRRGENPHLERDIDARVRKDFPNIVSSSFKVAAVVYILLVVLSIVDVSTTSLSQMVVTLLALGLLFAFIRVVNFKIESRTARRIVASADE